MLNDPANRPTLMNEMAKIAANRPPPVPFTPGQSISQVAQQADRPVAPQGKGQWAQINAQYAEGTPERAAAQMERLQQEYVATPDAGTRTVLAREIKRSGGTIPDAAAMAQANATPVAKNVVAPALQRPGDEVAKVSTSAVTIPSAGGQATATSSKPLEIPAGTKFGAPTTVVKADKPGGERALVTFVEDGDSLKLTREKAGKYGKDINCRIDTIDAPETPKDFTTPPKPGQRFGAEATQTLKQMVENKQVTLTVVREENPNPEKKTKENNYGRSLCQIEVQGVGVDKEMLRKGMAWLIRKSDLINDPKRTAELSPIEAQARRDKVGLFSDPNPQQPYRYRQDNK